MAARPFVAILLFASTSDAPDRPALYREDIVLIYAEDEQAAGAAAEKRAEDQVGSHRNADGETITLRLRQVVDVAPALDEDLAGGGDLYARHFTDIEAYARVETLLDESTAD